MLSIRSIFFALSNTRANPYTIIIILPYDPFGRNRMVRTIRNDCVEDSAIDYDDSTKENLLYMKGKKIGSL